jgi:hypothetical protein
MATGNYGIVRPADILPEDVEIFYSYSATRDVQGTPLQKLNPTQVLVPTSNPNNSSGIGFEIFGGLYTLKLPVTTFGVKGYYTIVIKPVEIRTTIVDVGVLSAYPDIKGLVFDLSTIPANFLPKFENDGLVGYRIEYLNPTPIGNNLKINNFFRVITSNNRCEPVNQNLTNTNQKAIRYRFNDNSTLTFATVSPASASNVKPNVLPYIGQPNQNIIISNTYFNPVTLEIEMVEYDISSLAIALYGNQTKSIDDGIYTIYDSENNIYRQYNLYEIRDQFNALLYEVRQSRGNNIDFSKNFTTITS